jgi:hypothetical protein
VKWVKDDAGAWVSGDYKVRNLAPKDKRTGWWLHFRGRALGCGPTARLAKDAAERHAKR